MFPLRASRLQGMAAMRARLDCLRPPILLLALALLLGGCARGPLPAGGPPMASATPMPAPPASAAPPAPRLTLASATDAPRKTPYTLAGGDRIRVFVYGQPSLSRIYAVDSAGFISMPLIGPLNVRGLTTYDLEIMLAARLGAKYVRDPKVSVEIAAYRPFFILGEVRNPGQYPYVPGMTVRTAVAIAGGYSPRANERKVQITRPINGTNHVSMVPSTYAVWPGDTIYVPERFF